MAGRLRQLTLMDRFSCNVCGQYCTTDDRVTIYQEEHNKGHGWKRSCIGYSHMKCCNWQGKNP